MQWLYCTWNCNDYLQYLLKRRRQKYIKSKPHTHLPTPKFFKSTLKKSIISSNSELYASTTRHEKQLQQINKAKTIDLWKCEVYNLDDATDITDDISSVDLSDGDRSWRDEYGAKRGPAWSHIDGECCNLHNRCIIFILFMIKSIFWHLLLHGGIFETYFNNLCKQNKGYSLHL